MTLLPLLLVALSAPIAEGPCSDVPAALPPAADGGAPQGGGRVDPAAAAYLAAGRAEWEAGEARGAAHAFREALRLSPDASEAREGLRGACARLAEEDALAEATAHLEAERPREALAALTGVRPDGPLAAAAALLRASAHLALGEDTRAREALAPALPGPQARGASAADALGEEEAQAAQLLAAVVALREGRGGEAARALAAVRDARDPRLRARAQGLLPLLPDAHRVHLSAALLGTWDSNLLRRPSTATAGAEGAASDGAGLLEASALWTPQGPWQGPRLGLALLGGKQARLAQFDAAQAALVAGWRLPGADVAAGADVALLGGAPFQRSLWLGASGRLSLGEGPWLLGGDVEARRQDFLQEEDATAQAFSGWRQQAGLALGFTSGPLLLSAGWRAGLDVAQVSFFSLLEHGPTLGLEWAAGGAAGEGLQLALALSGADRRYLAADPAFTTTREARREWQLGAALSAALPLSSGLSLVGLVQAGLVRSQVAALVPLFDHGRVAGTLGLRWSGGLP